MSIQISENGRLFGILAGLGGAAMIGSAVLPWKQAVLITAAYEGYDISLPGGARGRAMLVLGLAVIVGVATFIGADALRLRMRAGVVVVLAGAAGLIVAFSADPRSLATRPAEFPCTNPGFPPCIQGVLNGAGLMLAGWGSVLAVSYGIAAVLRRGEIPSGSAAEPRMSDAAVFVWTVVLLVIALAVYFFFVFVSTVLTHDSL
jgi:hypothetical protein